MSDKANELTLTRIYDAPVKAVWDAWTEPEQVAQWWGPRGFTLTHHSKELKPGGIWHYTMHGPDGTDYINKQLYHEVEECARLVYDHGGNDEQAPLFRVTATFEEIDGKTHMQMTMTLPSAEAAAQTKQHIKDAGGNSTWDRLAEYLAKQQSNKDVFVINRSFEAPIETVFDMWTQAQHISQWLGPTGSTMEYIETQVNQGGTCFYKMSDGKELKLFGKIHYQTIQKPDYLQYTQWFCDEQGNTIRHPMAPVWPEVMQTRVFFAPEGDQQTRITLLWEPSGDVSPEELQAFNEMKGSMTQGWSGSFDKLDEYLKTGL